MFNKLPKNKQLVLFDGVCNLCNSAVIKIIKNDTKDIFLFTSLQSEAGQQIVNHFSIDMTKVDSIILVTSDNQFYMKSTAALKIISQFGGIWKGFLIFWIIPRPIRDVVYNYIAKNRYRWFGKKESCMIPSPEIKAKFIDN